MFPYRLFEHDLIELVINSSADEILRQQKSTDPETSPPAIRTTKSPEDIPSTQSPSVFERLFRRRSKKQTK
jgi:hypothetical protein